PGPAHGPAVSPLDHDRDCASLDPRRRPAMTRKAGGSSSGSESRKRPAILQARFSAEEAADIKARADRAGTSVGSLIRSAVLSAQPPRATRRPSVNHEAVARMLGELGRVADAFRKAAAAADPRKTHALIDAA